MDEQYPPLDLKNLKVLSVLGRGARGVAFLVEAGSSQSPSSSSPAGTTLALKAISKTSIERRKKTFDEDGGDGYLRIWFERDVLCSLHHPLLPKLRGFLVTDKIVGFAIQYCSGGHLGDLRKKQSEKMFSDDIIRFYAAELFHALEYLHGLGIVYRDLKPENVLIQENGHVMLVDFDLSKKLSIKSSQTPSPEPNDHHKTPMVAKRRQRFRSILLCRVGISRVNSVSPPHLSCNRAHSVDSAESASDKSNSFVGTEDYVAPEVILGNGHDFAVDWWGLGVLLYEMLYGKTPFRGCNRKETFNRIVTQQPDLAGEETDLRDLIRRLLEKDPEKRISGEGIRRHAFFRRVDWEKVLEISRPPFIPLGRLEEGEGIDGQDEGIDVEGYVENIFNCDVGSGRSRSNHGKGVWVDGLNDNNNHNYVDDANFSMF